MFIKLLFRSLSILMQKVFPSRLVRIYERNAICERNLFDSGFLGGNDKLSVFDIVDSYLPHFLVVFYNLHIFVDFHSQQEVEKALLVLHS
jgi:hypothetical protein